MDVKELLQGLLKLVDEIEKRSESTDESTEPSTEEVEGLEGKASSG